MVNILPSDAEEAIAVLNAMDEAALAKMSVLLEACSRDEAAAMVLAEEVDPLADLADLMLEARRCHLLVEFYVGALLTPAEA